MSWSFTELVAKIQINLSTFTWNSMRMKITHKEYSQIILSWEFAYIEDSNNSSLLRIESHARLQSIHLELIKI